MSRKDYEAIAGKVAWAMQYADTCSDEGRREAARQALSVAVFGLSDVFAAENPRFDRQRFEYAAGVR